MCENDSTRTYLRRDVLKAGASIGAASAVLAQASAAARLSAQAAEPIENFGNLYRGGPLGLGRQQHAGVLRARPV
jgi:hypothetical protein